jgi:hypothetical protein
VNESDLDQTYTALAQAIGRCSAAEVPLFLSTLALSLIAREADCSAALQLIAEAEGLSTSFATHGLL